MAPAPFSVDANKIIEILRKKVEDLLWENTMLAAALESVQQREQILTTEVEQLKSEIIPPGGERSQMPHARSSSGSQNSKGPHREGVPNGT